MSHLVRRAKAFVKHVTREARHRAMIVIEDVAWPEFYNAEFRAAAEARLAQVPHLINPTFHEPTDYEPYWLFVTSVEDIVAVVKPIREPVHAGLWVPGDRSTNRWWQVAAMVLCGLVVMGLFVLQFYGFIVLGWAP